MSSPADLSKLLAQAQQMQSRVAQLQRDLARRSFEGSSGGGMVTAVATGDLRIVEIRLEPGLVKEGDQEMIQDLTAAAVNSALATAQRSVQQELQQATGGLNLGDLMNAATGGADSGSG